MSATLAALLVLGVAQGQAKPAPSVLIIQTREAPRVATSTLEVGTPPRGVARPPQNRDAGSPFDISSYFAGELETTGRMRPVVWSPGDPAFRAAMSARQVTYRDEFPTMQQAQTFADKAKYEYIAVVSGRLKDGMLHAGVKLFRAGKSVFEKEDSVAATVGATFDIEGSARTICRTWITILGDTVLKGQAVSPLIATPETAPGQVVTPPPVEPPVPVIDNRQLLADASALMSKDSVAEAVELLRDAVDQAPFDVERRTVFITLLLRAGEPRIAAAEARRAAELLQESVSLRAMAARAWIAAGEPDEAQEDLNQAVARDPENAETRTLLAEIALKNGQLPQAIEHLKVVLAKAASSDAHFKMAVAEAGAGNPDSVREHISKAGAASDSVDLRGRFEFSVDLIDQWAKIESGNLVALFQRALVRRTDPAVAEETIRLRKQLDGYLALSTALAAPTAHRPSHERRLLALRLMVQCGSDLTSFLSDGDEDVVTDARINLGEAIRSLNAARELYEQERG